MNQFIIYKDDEGRVCVVTPASEFVRLYGIEAVVAKDIPAGKDYQIVDEIGMPDALQEWGR